MKANVRVPLLSLGLAVVFLLGSMAFSGKSTSYWNGVPCSAGTQYGFPLPFQYDLSKSSELSSPPPSTHSTLVCPSGENVSPLKTNLSNALDDYLFWFVISVLLVFGLDHFLVARAQRGSEKKEPATKLPTPELGAGLASL